jgi:hypothetical protein
MPIYFLEPRDGNTSDPSWAASYLKEGCWVVSGSEKSARRKVEGATLKAVEFSRPNSPWLDWRFTTCRIDRPPHDIPTDQIVMKNGKVFNV